MRVQINQEQLNAVNAISDRETLEMILQGIDPDFYIAAIMDAITLCSGHCERVLTVKKSEGRGAPYLAAWIIRMEYGVDGNLVLTDEHGRAR